MLGPLFSIAQPFDEQYEWTWDTTSYPWTLNLVRPSNATTCEVRFGKNQREIQRDIDPTGIINRIYPKGYGEGVNQLTIREANNGRPYLENAASIAKYGLIPYVWVDRRFEDINSLKASAQALLDERSVPKVSYRISAVDLSSLTGMDIDKLRVGRIVRIIDPDLGTFEARIVGESKPDMVGSPGDIQLEIANKTENLGTTQADLERRQEINEVYAQGATNLLTYQAHDNADQDNPIGFRFELPEEMVRINKLVLTFETSQFRTYGRATEGGGATSTTTKGGGGTTATSSSGGGTTATSSSGGGTTATSTSGGGVSTSTASGGATTQSSSAGGNHTHKMFTAVGFQGNSAPSTSVALEAANGHRIMVNDGTSAGLEYYTQGSSGNHSHSVSVPSHTHDFNVPNHRHDVSIPNHTHDVSIPNHTHSVTIPDHTHDFTLPNHTHEIHHGIYKLNSTPSRVTIKVDGNTIPYTSTSGNSIDIVPYLQVDDSGKVTRGWHEIEITPNGLGRINAQVTTQFFMQSRGGGSF